MKDTFIRDTTNTSSVRIAVVQFDYQPSALITYPFIEEPVLLGEGEQGITSLHLSVPGVEVRIADLRHEVAEGYEDFIRQRVCRILDHLNSMSVDVVVFPEYSIPASCLAAINGSAGAYTVVAASHTVTPATVVTCRALGIQIEQGDVGKSICPIRTKDGFWLRVDKLTRSRFEGTLKLGTVWKPISVQNRDGREWLFAVFLCVDFLNENDENFQRNVPRDLWSKVHFGVVPSYSPTLKDFEQQARSVAERAGRPIAYTNVAIMGGSQVYCHFSEPGALIERHGTKPLARGDEAVVIVDLPLGHYAQFDHKPTPLPVPPTSQLVSLLPILSSKRFPQYCALHNKVRTTANDDQK